MLIGRTLATTSIHRRCPSNPNGGEDENLANMEAFSPPLQPGRCSGIPLGRMRSPNITKILNLGQSKQTILNLLTQVRLHLGNN